MKTITYEDFVKFNCDYWFTTEDKNKELALMLARYRAMHDEWSAIDILRLDEISAGARRFIVLETNIIDEPVLHEFACRCAERALSRVGKPDERSVAAIEAKQKWLRGEISDDELDVARDAAWSVVYITACAAERAAACAVERDAICAAAWTAECAEECAEEIAAEREWQIAELMKMLEGQE